MITRTSGTLHKRGQGRVKRRSFVFPLLLLASVFVERKYVGTRTPSSPCFKSNTRERTTCFNTRAPTTTATLGQRAGHCRGPRRTRHEFGRCCIVLPFRMLRAFALCCSTLSPPLSTALLFFWNRSSMCDWLDFSLRNVRNEDPVHFFNFFVTGLAGISYSNWSSFPVLFCVAPACFAVWCEMVCLIFAVAQ